MSRKIKKINEIIYNTKQQLELFSDEVKRCIVLHIPHSSDIIPRGYMNDYIGMEYLGEIEKWTDWNTEEIFNIPSIDQYIAPYSRVWCDVERFPDNMEPLVKRGRGYYYTHTLDGKLFRLENSKSDVYHYYNQYHNDLSKILLLKAQDYGQAILVDCHSFPDQYPIDICIGTDEYHTPDFLISHFYDGFRSMGYRVAMNTPYSGTFVPRLLYQNSDNIYSIMIEINRALYLDVAGGVERLNNDIYKLFDF